MMNEKMDIGVENDLDRILYGEISTQYIDNYDNNKLKPINKFLELRRYPLTYRQKAALDLYIRSFINIDLANEDSKPIYIVYSDKSLMKDYIILLNSAIDVMAQKRLRPDTVWFSLSFDPFKYMDKNMVWNNPYPRSTSVGRSDDLLFESTMLYSCELRDPSYSERRNFEGAFIGDIRPTFPEREYLIKAGSYMHLVDKYTLPHTSKAITHLVFEHVLTGSSPWIDAMLLIHIKERQNVDITHYIDRREEVDAYGRNLYFLAVVAQSQMFLSKNTKLYDRYTTAKEASGDFRLFANIDKYNRDIGYYVRVQPKDILHRDVYGNTPLMYKLLVNDMYLMTNRCVFNQMLHTSHLYNIRTIDVPNNDGLMPITMFDSIDILRLEGIERYLKLKDSLGRTALHRLVMIHIGFFLVSDKSNNTEMSIFPRHRAGELLERLLPFFDMDAKDIYGLTALDYYIPMINIYGNFLDIIFNREAWFKNIRYGFFSPAQKHSY